MREVTGMLCPGGNKAQKGGTYRGHMQQRGELPRPMLLFLLITLCGLHMALLSLDPAALDRTSCAVLDFLYLATTWE